MLPYGIVFKQNRQTMQQALTVWQKKFGLLKADNIIKKSILPIVFFSVFYVSISVLVEKEYNVFYMLYGLFLNCGLIITYIYLTAVKTVREYAQTVKESKVQIVLKEDFMEITTKFSKEIIPYNEIELCFEKDFFLTVIYDRYSFPIPISKVFIEKGNYDIFISLLKSRVGNRYVKKGEN